MKRVVVLGRGGAGKSTAARQLGTRSGLPVIELDQDFWQPGLIATPEEKWAAMQRALATADAWIMDGDLGPGDVPAVRLRRADTILVLDYSLLRCGARGVAARKGPPSGAGCSRGAAAASLLCWMLDTIRTMAPRGTVCMLRSPRQLRHVLSTLAPWPAPPSRGVLHLRLDPRRSARSGRLGPHLVGFSPPHARGTALPTPLTTTGTAHRDPRRITHGSVIS